MKISVIVCVFNQAIWVGRCLRSIISSVHVSNNFEIIVVNDGSTDGSGDIIEKFAKKYECITHIEHQVNRGLPDSINAALAESIGQYYVRVDSDDFIDRRMLYFLSTFLDVNSNVGAVASDYVHVDDNENCINRFYAHEDEIACGVMYRSELVKSLGGYNTTFKMREGHELRRRFQTKHIVKTLQFPFYYYRQHDKNRTKTSQGMIKLYDQKLRENLD